jgi:pimeloyl-ACP methyl ester carboxylesterase
VILFTFLIVAPILALWVLSCAAKFWIERRWPPPGQMVQVDSFRVHVADRPAAPGTPTLLFLHGASGNLREPLAALADALGESFRLIVVDRPGNGYTSRGGLDMCDPARQADLLAKVLTKLDVRSCLVAGHSWGAAVAAALGVRHPQQVDGLVLIAPATHPWPGDRISRRLRFFSRPYIGPVLAALAVVPLALLLMRPMLRIVFRPDPVPPDFVEKTGALLAIRPKTYVANCRDIANLNDHLARLAPHYREITAPTEVIAAEEDRIVSPNLHGRGLARDIPGARLTMLKNTGHMPHWSRTEEVVAAIGRVARQAAAQRERTREVASG